MPGHHSIQILRKKIGPKRAAQAKARAKAIQAEMLLTELRKLEGLTQVELAHKLGIKQPAVSQLEQQDDMQISTLQRIVNALGGVLEITVRLPGGEYRLGQFKNVPSIGR
ncbi:MAG TPA: XRE family transcriptional regulator [Phycisphaerae bacterium]|nr:XRE family transcriptional regulator [Phycisphaerae bacterium]